MAFHLETTAEAEEAAAEGPLVKVVGVQAGVKGRRAMVVEEVVETEETILEVEERVALAVGEVQVEEKGLPGMVAEDRVAVVQLVQAEMPYHLSLPPPQIPRQRLRMGMGRRLLCPRLLVPNHLRSLSLRLPLTRHPLARPIQRLFRQQPSLTLRRFHRPVYR